MELLEVTGEWYSYRQIPARIAQRGSFEQPSSPCDKVYFPFHRAMTRNVAGLRQVA